MELRRGCGANKLAIEGTFVSVGIEAWSFMNRGI